MRTLVEQPHGGIEVMSKGMGAQVRQTERFLAEFGVDKIVEEIAGRAAVLRRERPWLKSPGAVILASAQLRGRVLITRNIKDVP